MIWSLSRNGRSDRLPKQDAGAHVSRNIPHLRFAPMMSLINWPGLTAAALGLEAMAGYPAFLLRAMGHPIAWIGALIGVTEIAFQSSDPVAESAETDRSCEPRILAHLCGG